MHQLTFSKQTWALFGRLKFPFIASFLHLINTSCALSLKPFTHQISLHIIQSKACKTLWCTAASSSLSTVSPDAPAEQILLLIRLLVLLLSSLGLWPPPSVSPSPLFSSLSLVTASDLQQPSTETASWTSVSFRGSFSISGWIQNQGSELNKEMTLDWRKKDDRWENRSERWVEEGGGGWMCWCVDMKPSDLLWEHK